MNALLLLVLAAQVRASERGSVSQTVDGTTITLEYSRPVARGRDSLIGRIVHWGEVWTPGANWATTFDVDKDVQLDGQPVAKGKYSMWIVPRAAGVWTLFLSKRHRVFHTQRPDPKDAAVTIPIVPQTAPHVEVLTWSFPVVSSDGATLQLQWGTTLVAARIAVTPTRTARGERDITRYAGRYRFRWEDEEGQPESVVEIFVQDGRLRGRFEPRPREDDPEFDLVPAGQGFTPRYYRNGRVHEMDQETVVIFSPSGFEMRFETKVYARGTRLP